VLVLDEYPEDLGLEWTIDILWLKQSLVVEIKRWMPNSVVFQIVQECFSLKKVLSIRPLQRAVSAATYAIDNNAKAMAWQQTSNYCGLFYKRSRKRKGSGTGRGYYLELYPRSHGAFFGILPPNA
jgi:hypothetical protein